MNHRKFWMMLGAAAVTVSAVNQSAPVDAQSKSKAVAAPKPFTAQEKSEGAKFHPEILKEFGGPMQSPQTAYVVRSRQEYRGAVWTW